MRISSVCFETTAPDFDPMAAFRALYVEGEPACYFESDSENGRSSPVTVMGFHPIEELAIRDGQLRIRGPDLDLRPEGNPIENLKAHLAKYLQHKTAVPVPFSGGVVGFVGYDCVQYLERIELPASSEGGSELHLFVFRDYLIFDKDLSRLKLISLGRDSGANALDGLNRHVRAMFDKIERVNRPARTGTKLRETGDPPEPVATNADKTDFRSSIGRIKEHIKAGDIFQCVLSRPFEMAVKSKPLAIFSSLRDLSPAPYYFFLDTGEQVILGASPEMLVRVRGHQIQTCPIAGTRKRGKSENEDRKIARNLLASVKERAEHAMLVDLSRNDIGRIAKVKTVRVSKFMELRKFSHVMHLVSLVEGELSDGRTAWDALFSCFPAGTLSGAPKIRAMQIISELERTRRGFYGGAVVAADFAGNLDSCIAIRALSYKNGRVRLQAGAGVVADSAADREFQEILDKSRSVRAAIAAAEST